MPDMAETWQRAPVVFEWFGNYEYLQSKGWSFDAAVNFMSALGPLGRLTPASGCQENIRFRSRWNSLPHSRLANMRLRWGWSIQRANAAPFC